MKRSEALTTLNFLEAGRERNVIISSSILEQTNGQHTFLFHNCFQMDSPVSTDSIMLHGSIIEDASGTTPVTLITNAQGCVGETSHILSYTWTAPSAFRRDIESKTLKPDCCVILVFVRYLPWNLCHAIKYAKIL